MTTVFRGGSKKFARNDNRWYRTEFDHFRNGFRIPRTQVFGYNISFLARRLRHDFESRMRRLFMPVQRAFFPEIEISDQHDG